DPFGSNRSLKQSKARDFNGRRFSYRQYEIQCTSQLFCSFWSAALFGDWGVLYYGASCWLAFHIFVLAYEEPTLTRTYGSKYEAYQANVPRWIPRLTP